MTAAARTLTDADVEAIAEAVARRMRGERAANGQPKPAAITETMAAAARLELERRGLRTPRRAR